MKLFRLIFLLGVFFCAGTAAAHVEEDMPDPIKEMEYRILLEFEPDNTVVHNKLGMIYLRKNKFDEAAKEFSHTLKIRPTDFDALDGMGLVMAGKKHFDEAIRYYREALTINPADILVHYHLGLALEGKADLPAAADAYGRAAELVKKQDKPPRPQEAAELKKIEEALTAVRVRIPQGTAAGSEATK